MMKTGEVLISIKGRSECERWKAKRCRDDEYERVTKIETMSVNEPEEQNDGFSTGK